MGAEAPHAGIDLKVDESPLIGRGSIESGLFQRGDGGDEFVIILPGISQKEAVIVAEKIRKCIENAKFQKLMTVTIGVAQFREGLTRHDLVSHADKALYQAKNEGKNRVCVF